jgi:hypothetical protein
LQGVIAGLGGRDVTVTDLKKLIHTGFKVADKGEAKPDLFYGLKR